MPELRQGEVWWADLPEPAGRRPVLVLTRTAALDSLDNATIAPLTRTIRYIDTEVVLSPDEGVPSVCAVSLENILTIPQNLFDSPITRLSDAAMQEVFEAIRKAFAMTPE